MGLLPLEVPEEALRLPRLVTAYLPSPSSGDEDAAAAAAADSSFLDDDSPDSLDDWSDDRPDSADDYDHTSDSDDSSLAWNTSKPKKHPHAHQHPHPHLHHKKNSFHSACDYLSFFGALRKGFCSRPLDQRIEVYKAHKRADKSTVTGGGDPIQQEKKRVIKTGTGGVSEGYFLKDNEGASSFSAMFKCTVVDTPKNLLKRASFSENSDEQDINAHQAGAENLSERDATESDKKMRQQAEREEVPQLSMVLERDGKGSSEKFIGGSQPTDDVCKDMAHKEYGESHVELALPNKSKLRDENSNSKDDDQSSKYNKASEKQSCWRESDQKGLHNKGDWKHAMPDCTNKSLKDEGLTPLAVRFGVDGRINEATVGRGFANQLVKDHKKHSKRRKGKGALSKQRKRLRVEKAQTISNDPIIEENVDGRRQGERVTSTTKVESIGASRKAEEKQQQSGSKIVATDTGPEEGEVIEEDSRGLLSQLVEEEVGLWTTDVGDEQITSSKIDSDEDGKKKVRAPISAERKLKKKVAFRRKRAEKEKELGIRRPRLPVNTFKPKLPLCKFYIKGRCTLGAKCTFSHDVVPITKSDPCKFFMVNRCLKGDDCPFSHTLDTFPCKFWHTRGHCLDGNNCRFSHGPLTDDQRQNLVKRIEHDSKEQLNMADIPRDLNNAPEDSESEDMPTLNRSQTEPVGWDVNPSQALNQDTVWYASTSMACQSLLNSREVLSAAPCGSFIANQSSVRIGEVNKEEIQLTDTYKEDTPAENAVLLAARKAASAAAWVSRVGSPTSISLPKSRSFGRSLAGRGSEASAMDLLQASLSSDNTRDLLVNANSSSQAISNTGTLSAPTLSSAGAGSHNMFPSSSPLSRATPSSLARGSSFGHSRQVVALGNKASAMELLQASLGNEATPEDNT